ncbi:glycosyltransferase family 2 protein [Cyanobium sp. NIES-981]|uniref:glycosyltransferase n=1 Tax=Cyanobium sp. NIES-981 TaxID=1851505 RepID=UPI0007DCE7A4|nr:glycosyltransferase [Cyanobium sp. NIES-981]SBO44887.1 protein of unknown function [Cyanobium sp. NIES-981]
MPTESSLAEIIHYFCERQKISACLIVASADTYSRILPLIPAQIRPHFILCTQEIPSATSQERSAWLEARLQECLVHEDDAHTLILVEADSYLHDSIPLDSRLRTREVLQRQSFCLSLGLANNVDYHHSLNTVNSTAQRLLLEGEAVLTTPEGTNQNLWIELFGSHYTPETERSTHPHVAAIIIAHNESDVLEECLSYLHGQGVATYLLDDESDDGTEAIAHALLERGVLAGYERSGLPEDCQERWSQLLALSFAKAQTLDADWIIHHDADELRESPWEGVSLAKAIGMIDGLGYNCIDHTVVEFLFTQDSDSRSAEGGHQRLDQRLTRFRFPSHRANFTQFKAWKKADQQTLSEGGHRILLNDQAVFPLKFLIKHYPLRSAAHARRKVLTERNARLSPERRLLGWHTHYDAFQYFQEIEPWSRRELHPYNPTTFYREFLIERISGCNLERTDYIDLNILTTRKIIDAQERFRSQAAQILGLDLEAASTTAAAAQGMDGTTPATLWTLQTRLIEDQLQALVTHHHRTAAELEQARAALAARSAEQAALAAELATCTADREQTGIRLEGTLRELEETRGLLQEKGERLKATRAELQNCQKVLNKTRFQLDRSNAKLEWNRSSLRQTSRELEHRIHAGERYGQLLHAMADLLNRLSTPPASGRTRHQTNHPWH